MFFLNLTLGEFLGLLGVLSGVITALYLLDRAKKKKIVSTLRFWSEGHPADEQRRRKHVREPWSLILQLLSLLLLLLAIAQVQWGTREHAGRDHVLLLDCSSWMTQRKGNGTLLDEAKRIARGYVSSMATRDRVMLVRVDGLTTPATGFTNDHKQLLNAIANTKASYSGLDLERALQAASGSLHRSGGNKGEIVYIGAKHVTNRDTSSRPSSLRVIPVKGSDDNVGIRRVGVRQAGDQADMWQAYIAIRNYGKNTRTITLRIRFADSQFAPRRLTLAAGQEQSAEYRFSTNAAGILSASIEPADALPIDDHVQVQLPRADLLRVAVYTDRPEVLRPLLDANHRIEASYFTLQQYSAKPKADVILLDRVAPPGAPELPSLWLAPPSHNSPVEVIATETNTVLTQWHNETALGSGLRSKELKLATAEVFSTEAGDIPIADTERGAVVVARPSAANRPRLAVVGFDPLHGSLRFELSTPLLFANLLHWLEPESFRSLELTASAVGSAAVALDAKESAEKIRVADDAGFSVPFTVRNGMLQLYASRPSTVHIFSDERERVLSLTLPEIAEFNWEAPAGAPEGLPASSRLPSPAADLWKWLAVLGGLGLLAEWLFFGKQHSLLRGRAGGKAASETRARDLVAK